MKLLILFTCLISGCAREPPEVILGKLDALKREAYADIARQRSECNAVAIEFNGDKRMVENCQDTYRFVVDNARRTISDIDKRIAELHREECATILAEVKKNGGGFVPFDCEEKPLGRFVPDEEVFGKEK